MCLFNDHLQVSRRLRTTEPIARQANEVYTKAMYMVFDEQLYKSGHFVIDQRPTENTFVLIDMRQEEYGYRHEITVKLEDKNYIRCSCGLFEHMGMLCGHSLKVRNIRTFYEQREHGHSKNKQTISLPTYLNAGTNPS